jgi:acyl-coenzyme A synthetase/AMP-(fatty) acid ligase
MLYSAWKQIARSRANELALVDLAAEREWTFAQLEAEVEKRKADEPIIYPSGCGYEFIFDVLRAWRMKRIVCPLDQGQAAPETHSLPARCVHLKTSSGSATGTPQLIAFTGEQLAADARNIVNTMGLRPDWPNLGMVSLAHSYGFSNLVSPLLLHGIPLILSPSRLPEALRQACEEYESLTLAAVPALWRVWHEANGISPTIKLAISAGAPLPAGLETAIFQRSGVKAHNFYGASECGGICYDSSKLPRSVDEDVGAPLDGVKLDLDGEGCLVVTSEAAGETYWPQSGSALGNGTFRTGDRAELRGGRVFLRGRRGDVINLAGRKVAPELIEQAILRHPGVRQCVVFGVPEPDGARGESIAACVCASGELTEETLRHFLNQSLPEWQAPRHWWFVPEIAASERGKISRAIWRERFLGRF